LLICLLPKWANYDECRESAKAIISAVRLMGSNVRQNSRQPALSHMYVTLCPSFMMTAPRWKMAFPEGYLSKGTQAEIAQRSRDKIS